jgi:hypothetical protein
VPRWLVALAVTVVLVLAGLLVACSTHERGYLSPQFSPDGASVVVIARETRALVFGFGYETFTPPARSRVIRDRFSLLRIHVADGGVAVLHEFPASPLEGGWVRSYRPSLAGSASAHLRWATPDALEYEIAVSRPRQPTSETFVTRQRWNTTSGQLELTGWTEGSAGMGGIESTQLHGDREVVALRAGGALPCAVLLVTEGQPLARPLLEESECRKAFPDGYPVARLSDVIHRPAIMRVEHLRETHARLQAAARARGLSEGDAALAAIRGMQQLGLYPRPSRLVATRVAGVDPGVPVFEISDTEFMVGLFPDIRAALDSAGTEVEKSIGDYIIHRDYDTSRQLNAWLADRARTTFYVRADGATWKLELTRR